MFGEFVNHGHATQMTGDDSDRDILDEFSPASALSREMGSPFNEIHIFRDYEKRWLAKNEKLWLGMCQSQASKAENIRMANGEFELIR